MTDNSEYKKISKNSGTLINNIQTILSDSSSLKPGTNQLTDVAYQKVLEYFKELDSLKDELDSMIKSQDDNYRTLLSNSKKNEEDATNLLNKNEKYEQNIWSNKDIINSRSIQYDLAMKRNEHRRQMVIMLAILNTLLLFLYYFLSK
jgi:hypothetical protein